MQRQSEILDTLAKIKKNHLEVCIFGCGNVGTGGGYDILRFLGLDVQYYIDNDPILWGKIIKTGIRCISPEDLSKKKNMACFVMMGVQFQNEIVNQLKEYGIEIIITYIELCSLDIVVDHFIEMCSGQREIYDEKNNIIWTDAMLADMVIRNANHKKYVVYTCIVGDYDSVTEPEHYLDECDYFLISDKKPDHLKIFKWIDVNKIVPKNVQDNSRRNRFCKMHAPYIFAEYDYSIYVDGNICILGDIRKHIDKIGKSGIATFRYPRPMIDCLYEHALMVVNAKFDKNNSILQQIDYYHKIGMPRHYGLSACGILVRDHTNPICKKVMLDWWNEIFNRSYRDQLSFTYCLWKNGLKYEDVGMLVGSVLENDDFKLTSQHHYTNGKWTV